MKLSYNFFMFNFLPDLSREYMDKDAHITAELGTECVCIFKF